MIVVLLIFTAIFWTFFELAGSALSLFTERNVDKAIFGHEFKTSNFQAVNALFVVMFAPLFLLMWYQLAKIGRVLAADPA